MPLAMALQEDLPRPPVNEEADRNVKPGVVGAAPEIEGLGLAPIRQALTAGLEWFSCHDVLRSRASSN